MGGVGSRSTSPEGAADLTALHGREMRVLPRAPLPARPWAESALPARGREAVAQGHSKNAACHEGDGVGAILAEVLAGFGD